MIKLIISLGNSKERLPIVIIDCYVLITIFLYYFGPVEFKSPYSPYMVLYLLLLPLQMRLTVSPSRPTSCMSLGAIARHFR